MELQRELRGFDETPGGLVAQVTDTGSDSVESIRATWLVGCDGAHSTVRHLLRLPMQGGDYNEHLVLGDVHVTGNLPEGLNVFWLNDDGLLVGLPFREPGLWRLVAVVTPDAGGNVPEASIELFQRLLAERAGDTTARLTDPVWLSNFMVRRRMVPRFRVQHALLAGDAAHIHSPAGGQGMNTGIQDSYNLGWKLAMVLGGLASEELINSYEAERLPVARTVLQQTDANQRWGIAQGGMVEFLRNYVVFPLLGIPALRERFVEFALRRNSELDINYRDSTLSEECNRFQCGPHAGDRAPDGQLVDSSGAATSVFAHFRTPEFRLLAFQDTTAEHNVSWVVEVGRGLEHTLAGRMRCTIVTGPPSDRNFSLHDEDVVCDPTYATHRTYGADEPSLYLVRPDGYVAFRSRLRSASKLVEYLQRNFVALH